MSWYTDSLQRMSLRVVTPPTDEPISLDDARLHLRLEAYDSPPYHADDDWLSTVGIPAAREHCEIIAGKSFAPQTFELTADAFPGWYAGAFPRRTAMYPYWSLTTGSPMFSLPMPPVTRIVSVTYATVDGDVVLGASDYGVDSEGRLYATYGNLWPTTALAQPGSVRVRYVAGFSAEGDSPQDYPLPARYRSAMLLMLGHLYENREATVARGFELYEMPLGIQALLMPDRARIGFA